MRIGNACRLVLAIRSLLFSLFVFTQNKQRNDKLIDFIIRGIYL